MPPLPKNDKPIDITQIAQALGVSKTTVSRAISGNGRISAATRQRVLDYVKEHNYTPSMMARGLVKRCSYNISLVISTQFSDFELPFLRKVMRSVYQVAGDSDYDVLLTLVGENETRPVERLLDNRKIDGLILTRTLERDPLIPLLKARKVPFVAIGQPEDDQVLSVDHDQVGGCREMTSLLLMKGMKHIALLGGSMLYTVNQSRLEGFQQAFVEFKFGKSRYSHVLPLCGALIIDVTAAIFICLYGYRFSGIVLTRCYRRFSCKVLFSCHSLHPCFVVMDLLLNSFLLLTIAVR